jgi:hypothetical protein
MKSTIYEAELYDLLKFAKAFASLGSAVQDQLDDLANERFEQVNPNALYPDDPLSLAERLHNSA